jgi:glycosyltransferase involved in cell wall biosynthesis
MSESRLRVAIFGESYLPYLSGVTVSTQAVAGGLAAAGHEVLLVVPRPAPDVDPGAGALVPDGVRVAWLPSYQARGPVPPGYRMPWPVPSAALRAARAFRPQIVHAQSPFVSGLMAVRVSRRVGAALVFTHHTRFGDYGHYLGPLAAPGAWLTSAYLRAWWRQCAGIVAPSTDLAEEILGRLRGGGASRDGASGQGPSRREPVIRVIPTGLDVAAIQARPAEDPRTAAGWPADSQVVVSVGRLAREKSVDLLVDAFGVLAAAHPQARLLLIGDGPMRSELAARAQSSSLSGRLRLAGALPRADALALASGADCFAFASRTETQGLVLAEALTCGLPVVALDGPGVSDSVRDGVDGIVVPRTGDAAADAQGLADGIIGLLGDPEQRQRMADAGASGRHRFDLENRIRELVDLYGEVLARR